MQGGSPPWWVSLIVSWLPFIGLVVAWVVLSWQMNKRARTSSGARSIDLQEQRLAEARRMNALLERIAVVLEKR